MEELFTVYGSVSGTGDYTLDSDIFASTVNYIRIPKGTKLKVWCKRISGSAAEVQLKYTSDVTSGSPVYKTLDVQKLASDGELSLEKRRPMVMRGITGKEAFKVTRSSGSGYSYIALEVEISDE